ncbi:MAG: tetratricopeptide repeat protein [Acidobacteriota bacterium]
MTELLIPAAFVVSLLILFGLYRWMRKAEKPVRGRMDHRGLHPGLSAGLSAVLAGEREQAIQALREVVEEDTDAVEVYLLLGDLHRELGQGERALRIHRSVLGRSGLTRAQRIAALTSLGRDFEAAGFLDKAQESFEKISELRPKEPGPWRQIRRLAERSGDWERALAVQEKLVPLASDREREERVLAFLHDRVGEELMLRDEHKPARKHLDKALKLDPDCIPARIHLGDLFLRQGHKVEAGRTWQQLVRDHPEHGVLVLERLETLHAASGEQRGYDDVLEELASQRPRDVRVKATLARRRAGAGRDDEARQLVLEAFGGAPRATAVHRVAWDLASSGVVDREQARRCREILAATPELPHSCLRCRYRTDEATWRCPHCHRWGTMVLEEGW